MADLVKGTVKTFNKNKGFGFITTEDGKDVFFHYSALVMEGFKTTVPGQKVEFKVETTEKGDKAVDIHLVQE